MIKKDLLGKEYAILEQYINLRFCKTGSFIRYNPGSKELHIKKGKKHIFTNKVDAIDSIEIKRSYGDFIGQGTLLLRINGVKYVMKKLPKKELPEFMEVISNSIK